MTLMPKDLKIQVHDAMYMSSKTRGQTGNNQMELELHDRACTSRKQARPARALMHDALT
jgi:hypothetical protein